MANTIALTQIVTRALPLIVTRVARGINNIHASDDW